MPNHHPFSNDDLKPRLQAKTRAKRRKQNAVVALESTVAVQTRNDLQPELVVVERAIDALRPANRRARRTTDAQLMRVVRSIGAFQQVIPILIDSDDRIIAGHIVWEAMRQLERPSVQCIVVGHLDEAQRRAFAIAHNRLAETGEWDIDELKIELQELDALKIDLTLTGLTLPEIDIVLAPPAENAGDAEEEIEPDATSVVLTGDLFALCDHRLLCGDALSSVSYLALLGEERVHAIFSDPPYNCKIEGNVGGLGKHKHKDFAMAVGEMPDEAFCDFLGGYLKLGKEHAADGAVVFACMDWRQIDLLLLAGKHAGLSRINMAVWNKQAGGMGSLYRSAHELIAVFCTGSKPATNNVELGRFGRDRTNVWTYAGANRRGSSASEALADHPTPKPVEMVADAILDVTNRGDLVLDPFMGSGSTLMACEQTGRAARGIELDPQYVAAIIRRWENKTGEQAIHVETGLTYDELVDSRMEEDLPPADRLLLTHKARSDSQ